MEEDYVKLITEKTALDTLIVKCYIKKKKKKKQSVREAFPNKDIKTVRLPWNVRFQMEAFHIAGFIAEGGYNG